ncbi:Plastid division protein [Nymphaea thermarum]|nr:Plastid division protein [Nymphaea thermarum]
MEGNEIGMVMCRVSELRSKITGCIHKATADFEDDDGEQSAAESEAEEEAGEEEKASRSFERLCSGEAEGEAQNLFGIRDALDSLEEQLASLQALQHQQLYERESTLAEIDQSRKILLKKLMEYKGENLEVIQEASAFAGGTIENGGDLFLPPYPSRLPESVIYEGRYRPRHPPSNMQLAHLVGGKHEMETMMNGSHKKLNQLEPPVGEKKSQSGIKSVIGWAAKTVIAIVGIVSVLSLAGFEPRIRRRNVQFKTLNLLSGVPDSRENTTPVQCPPGKVLVMEDGIPRCMVKERIEVPFKPVLKAPDVSYGFG